VMLCRWHHMQVDGRLAETKKGEFNRRGGVTRSKTGRRDATGRFVA
jgi:hypothetical protein